MTVTPPGLTEAPEIRSHRSELAGLEAALDGVRLEGAIFLRGEYTEAWALESPPAEVMASLLSPGSARLLLFHVVASGSCWIALKGHDPVWAERGDVIVLPYGDQHVMGGRDATGPVNATDVLTPPPWQELPVVRLGDGGARTDIVCGYLDSDHPLFDPSLRALPSLFVVRPGPAAATWMEASFQYALEASRPGAAAPSPIVRKIPQLLLTEVLRIHLHSAPAAGTGWLAALHDPVLAPALALLHAHPEEKWTVADLAAGANVSRSALDERFRQVLGRAPIRYLTDWRMHVAKDLLATTDLGVKTIARRVGYDSEEAFSRAFKRAFDVAPVLWRLSHHA